jgi:hypothetical protein
MPGIKKARKMHLYSHFALVRFSKFAKIFLSLAAVGLLFACQPLGTAPTSPPPFVEVQIVTPSFLTETPVPPCVVLSDVELTVEILSENSVRIRITGLVPNETVHAIFSSKIKGQEREATASGPADEKGVFEYSVGLRGPNLDTEFKEWQVQVVHSRGSTCTEFVLPDKQMP